MAVITITTAAKCKHCKFADSFRIGKQKRHKCNNPQSERYLSKITLKDLVCSSWGI